MTRAAPTRTILLHGGTVIDGSGAARRRADVLIRGERIVEAGHFEAPADAERIDCSGQIVCPGFIDAHSHSDLQVLERRPEKIAQGVTSEVVGNCGFSTFPAPTDRRALHEFANGIFCGQGDWGWPGAREYLEAARQRAPFAGVAALAGHGTLRIALAGPRQGELTAGELGR